MIFFVAHDPGARNHVLPLFEHAKAQGLAARFIDLAAPQHIEPRDSFQGQSARLLVTGWSVNQAEWPWVQAARRHGIKSAAIIDVGIGQTMDNFAPAAGPDHYIVTSTRTREELLAREVPACRVSLTGNPYLEWLIQSKPAAMDTAWLQDTGGCNKNLPIVSVFLPDFGVPAGSLKCLANLLGQSELAECHLVICPHPRDPHRNCAQATNSDQRLGSAVWDWECKESTPALLAASVCSLTFGSTVSMESLALGTPSAYFQIGWDYQELDQLYANHSSVPRLRCAREFFGFVSGANTKCESHSRILVENYLGATAHAWKVLQKLMPDGKPK